MSKQARYEKLCTTIERWQRKLDRADRTVHRSVKMLTKLERQRTRVQRAMAAQSRQSADDLVKTQAESIPAATSAPTPTLSESCDAIVSAMVQGKTFEEADGLAIPPVLDRTRKLQAMADPRTKEKKAERRAVEKELRNAELTGKRRKMPLQGKEALAVINRNR
jgi:hypothetical protein